MPRLVIFDLDEVLVDFLPEARLERLAALTGRPPDALHAAWWGSDHESRAEAGEHADGAGYLQAFNARIGFALTRGQWIEARRAAMRVRTDVLDYARALATRVPLALLTNNGPLLRETLPELVPGIGALFGPRLHASADFGARKPEPAVFERLLARHGIAAPDALMIDDQEANVAGARSAGLAAIRYRDLPDLAARLEHWLATR
ncbi:MAG: HAD family phosphatase [Steroidobacteraceae bacterium]